MNPTRRKQDKNLITPCKTNLSPRYIRSNPRIPKKIPRRMKELKSFFEIQTSLKFIKNKEQIHFHKFIKGDWFGLHNDVREKRLFAVGVLLNNDFEGGNFKLYNPNEITLNKEIGNTYVFDVRIKHEITPILNGIRYSLLWFLESNNIKMNINNLI